MTERRPHWDDDLIESVFRIMDNYAAEVWRRVVDHGTPTFDIITAVEDWHDRQGEENLPLLMAMMNAESTKFRRRAEKADAAIQRVRELCERSRAVVRVGCRCCTDECSGTCGAGEPLAWDLDPADVLRALEDECPTCEGPIRETVGLVCQTCGTDYGDNDG